MERFKMILKSLKPRNEAMRSNPSQLIRFSEELPPLENHYSHEKYPIEAIELRLNNCKVIADHLPKADAKHIQEEAQKIYLRHEDLTQELHQFNRQADALGREILALTAAAKPLQEPGIATSDVKSLRAALTQQADELRKRRAAYESEAKILEERIQHIISEINVLYKNACMLAKKYAPQL